MLTPVSVAANRGSTAEVRLLRGASVSGVVRFDDGSPDGSADVKLWSKNKKGEWAQYKGGLLGSAGGSTTTDDAGQFRFSGLPAGEYLLSVGLEVTTVMVDRVGDRTEGWYSNSLYTLKVFAPGATRKKDATVLKLGDQQASDGVEIEVPLSKMHAVTESLAQEGSGRVVNAGHVSLVYRDDGSELAGVDVTAEDDTFHMTLCRRRVRSEGDEGAGCDADRDFKWAGDDAADAYG